MRLKQLAVTAAFFVIGTIVAVAIFAFATNENYEESRITVERSLIDSSGNEPLCIPKSEVCLVDIPGRGIVAFYAVDTHPFFRERNCEVKWLVDYVSLDPQTGHNRRGWFKANCSGSVFDLTGKAMIGPSARNLDEFEVQIEQEKVTVFKDRLTCGLGPPPVDTCDFAPDPE